MQKQTKLIAIVGGSGAGKTWLARRLESKLNPNVSRLSLDDFYCDRANLESHQRETVNYDHPQAIDWPRVEGTLRACRAGQSTYVPQYNFSTHTRMLRVRSFSPRSLVLAEGLWLLARPRIRALFDFTVYLDCPIHLRLERRIERDAIERGRQPHAVRKQFWDTVAPMHDRFVAPQLFLADVLLKQPSDAEIENLAVTLQALMSESDSRMDVFPGNRTLPASRRAPIKQVLSSRMTTPFAPSALKQHN